MQVQSYRQLVKLEPENVDHSRFYASAPVKTGRQARLIFGQPESPLKTGLTRSADGYLPSSINDEKGGTMSGSTIDDAFDNAIRRSINLTNKQKVEEFFEAIGTDIPTLRSLVVLLTNDPESVRTTIHALVKKSAQSALEGWRKLNEGIPILKLRLLDSRVLLDSIRPDEFRVLYGDDLVYGDTACETLKDVIVKLFVDLYQAANMPPEQLTVESMQKRLMSLDVIAFQRCCDATRQEVMKLADAPERHAATKVRPPKTPPPEDVPDEPELNDDSPTPLTMPEERVVNSEVSRQEPNATVAETSFSDDSGSADDTLPTKLRKLAPSRIKAKAIYEWAISAIPDAEHMTNVELYDAIECHPSDASNGLPPSAETFGRYLRDAGVKRYCKRTDKAGHRIPDADSV